MNNLIDSLFKKKLETHAIEPGANAWSRVVSNLPKKNRAIIWFRAAAVLLLAGVASTLWFYSNKQTATSNTIVQTEQKAPVKEDSSQDPEKKSEPQQFITSNPPINKKGKKEPILIRKPKPNVDEPSTPIDIENNLTTGIAVTETPEILQPEESVITPAAKPMVIVYELKRMDKKLLPEFEEELLPEKKTGFRKVLDVANEMRRSENPFGELRQAKEDIFAFNFKKESRNNK